MVEAANNVLKPIVDRGYSRNDLENGNRMPYLQPTDGLPRLVKGPRVTESFKATPNKTALPRLGPAINTLGENRERMVTPLQRLRDLTRNWRPQREANPVAAEEAS